MAITYIWLMQRSALLVVFASVIGFKPTAGCPANETLSPCSCSDFDTLPNGSKLRYHVSCENVTYDTLKAVFANLSRADDPKHYERFSVIKLYTHNGHLEDDFFSELTIETVSITYSKLKSFGHQAFRGVSHVLDLSNNEIESLPEELSLYVRRVNLSNNQIKEIGPNTFASIAVDLSGNHIKHISKGAFKVTSGIDLILSNNHLEDYSIRKGFLNIMGDNPQVNLDLSNNSLTHLDYDTFSTLLSPQSSINIAHNQLICDCRIKWIQEIRRYGENGTLLPRVMSGHCPDGKDLVKQYYSPDLSECAEDILREDVDILSPCKLSPSDHLLCYRVSYDSVKNAVEPLGGLLKRPLPFENLFLDRIVFSDQSEGHFEDIFPFVRVNNLKIVSSNIKSIDPKAFSSTSSYVTTIDLGRNQLSSDSNVFDFLSKFVSLKTIFLNNNQITTIPRNAFKRMPRLTSVMLQNNAITVIQRSAFSLPVVSPFYRSLTIDLQNNGLSEKSFEHNFLETKRSVKITLNLARNAIRDVAVDGLDEALHRNDYSQGLLFILNDNPVHCTLRVKQLIAKRVIEYEDCYDE